MWVWECALARCGYSCVRDTEEQATAAAIEHLTGEHGWGR